MKVSLFLLLALLPLAAQEPTPAPPAVEKIKPLKAKPSRDLFDFASLLYNAATEEKDAAKKKETFRLAARKFDTFLRAYPKDKKALDSWYFLGLCYRQTGEIKASRKCFESAATHWKTGKFVEASALYLASEDYSAEKWRSAAKWFKVVAGTTKDNQVKHESLYRRFLCYDKIGEKTSILLALKAVLADKGSPFEETARLSLARLYQTTQSHRQAHEQFVILSKSPKKKIRSDATLQAALTAQKLGDKALTKTWFAKALREPGLKDLRGQTQLALMNLHYQDKEWSEVIKAYRKGNFDLKKDSEVQRLIMAAKSYEALKQDDQVLALSEKISKLSPGSANSFSAAYRILVRDHEQKKSSFAKTAEAFLKTYNKEHAKDPRIHSVRLLVSEHYYARKQYQKAIDHYRLLDLKVIDPSNQLGVRYHVAKSQLALKNEKGALAAIDAFVKSFPKSKQATQLHLDRAELLTSKGRESEALDDYQKVLAATKNQKLKRIILLRLSAVYQEKKDWKNFTALQNKILLLPNLDRATEASANFWLGWNEYRLKKAATAVPYFKKSRELDAKTYAPKVAPLLVRAAYQAEDIKLLEKEINALRRVSKSTKLPSSILTWLGATLSKQEKHQRAWPFLKEGLKDKSKPASGLIWKLFAISSLETQNYKSALEASTNLLAIEKNAYRKAEAHYFQSRALTGLKKFIEARDATSEALKLRPQGELDIQLRTHAGDIDIAAGKPQEALRHYVVVESLYAKTAEQKKSTKAKVISTLRAIGTPAALEKLKEYQK